MLVIARYQEDIRRWIGDFKKDKVIVYNKHYGENLLPNVGREAHTYLYHIINNYDNLSPTTFFFQGDVFSHVLDKQYRKIIDMVNYDAELDLQFFGCHEGFAEVLTFEEYFKFMFFSNGPRRVIANDMRTVQYFAYSLTDCRLEHGCDGDAHVYPTHVWCNFGAMFAVSRDRIRNRSLKWYQEMMQLVDWHYNPIGAHFFERAWPFVFGEMLPLFLVKFWKENL